MVLSEEGKIFHGNANSICEKIVEAWRVKFWIDQVFPKAESIRSELIDQFRNKN